MAGPMDNRKPSMKHVEAALTKNRHRNRDLRSRTVHKKNPSKRNITKFKIDDRAKIKIYSYYISLKINLKLRFQYLVAYFPMWFDVHCPDQMDK